MEAKRLKVVAEYVQERFSGDNETDNKTRIKKYGEAMSNIEVAEESADVCKKLLFG